MATKQPNVEAVEFFLSLLDMEAENMNRFINQLRHMGTWPEGVTPLLMAETLESLMEPHYGSTTAARLAARGENF